LQECRLSLRERTPFRGAKDDKLYHYPELSSFAAFSSDSYTDPTADVVCQAAVQSAGRTGMFASVRALLNGIIDYAGMFPPAKLPLEHAFRNYLRYRQEVENWMLGRFVCPVPRLVELASLLQEVEQPEAAIPFSVLGTGGSSQEEFVANFKADLEAIANFGARFSHHLIVDTIEIRLPPDIGDLLAADRDNLLFANVSEYAEWFGPKGLAVYYEIPMRPKWRDGIEGLVRIAATANDWRAKQGFTRCRKVGVKLRCGGLEAAAFPRPEQVAFTINTCRDAGVALKFTAGLHHPIRHYDQSVQTKMHGFLNVFGAGVLAHAHGLSIEQVQEIIADEDPKSFSFTDGRFGWKQCTADTKEIASIRQKALISFGSCSFDEPRDDLRTLGLLV
jgi:hypothetical protein